MPMALTKESTIMVLLAAAAAANSNTNTDREKKQRHHHQEGASAYEETTHEHDLCTKPWERLNRGNEQCYSRPFSL